MAEMETHLKKYIGYTVSRESQQQEMSSTHMHTKVVGGQGAGFMIFYRRVYGRVH